MHNPISKLINIFFAAVLSTLLVACGGSGGGGSGSGTGTYTFAFTADNAEEVVRLTLSTKELLEGLGFVGSTFWDVYNAMGGLVAGVPTVVTCDTQRAPPGSGTASITWTDVDLSGTKSSGDTFTVDFTNCSDSLYGWIIGGGQVVITLNSQTGLNAGVPTAMNADLAFNTLVVNLNGVNITVDGMHTIDFDADMAGTDTYDVTGNKLDVSGVFASGESFISTLSAYNYALTLDCTAGCAPFTYQVNGTLNLTDLTFTPPGGGGLQSVSGTALVVTNTTFAGTGIGAASVGDLEITGAASSVIMTALDIINVRIDTDEDGDGTIDATANALWDDLFY